MSDLLANRVLMVPGAAWLVAQILKVLVSCSLSTGSTCACWSAPEACPAPTPRWSPAWPPPAIQHGVGSSLFAIVLVFATIVMYDAAGVRRAVGIRPSSSTR